jgi:hypothetical protein
MSDTADVEHVLFRVRYHLACLTCAIGQRDADAAQREQAELLQALALAEACITAMPRGADTAAAVERLAAVTSIAVPTMERAQRLASEIIEGDSAPPRPRRDERWPRLGIFERQPPPGHVSASPPPSTRSRCRARPPGSSQPRAVKAGARRGYVASR